MTERETERGEKKKMQTPRQSNLLLCTPQQIKKNLTLESKD